MGQYEIIRTGTHEGDHVGQRGLMNLTSRIPYAPVYRAEFPHSYL